MNLSFCMSFRRVAGLCTLLLMLSTTVLADGEKVLLLTGSHSNKAQFSLLKEQTDKNQIALSYMSAQSIKEVDDAEAVFSQYDLVLFHSVSPRLTEMSFLKYQPIVEQSDRRYLAISWPDGDSLRKDVTVAHAKTLYDYYKNGGKENLRRMARFLRSKVFDQDSSEVQPAIIYPSLGIYHPDYDRTIFNSLPEYLAWLGDTNDNANYVGVMFQRALIESGSTDVLDKAITEISGIGLVPIPFFYETSRTSTDYSHLLSIDSTVVIDSIVNFRAIHWASKRKEEFEALGVPVIQALTYYDGDQQHWENNSQGIAAGMSSFQLVLPESAGVIDPIIVAATNEETGHSEVIDYQLQHLIRKTAKLSVLKHKPQNEKKLSVMVWGNRDVGASFLNVPDSLSAISKRLASKGYGIPPVSDDYFTDRIDRILNPFYRSYELESLIDEDLAELMPVQDYLSWFNQLPESVRQPINEYWGLPKDNFMVVERDGLAQFVLPRIRVGNMLVMRQPPRADNNEEDQRIYHKGTIPMNHYYLAAYYYVRQHWGSDAIVHLGTHGSQEYLPGKERGLSLYDQGNLATWDTPVVYPFIVDDVGEAMQTKRRGSATVLAHMTPPFAAAGLQGEVADIHELMHQYKSMEQGGVKQKTAAQITDNCLEHDLCKDISWQRPAIEADFDGFIEALHAYLEDLASQNQPLGLHTFGELPEDRLINSTIIQMLGGEFVTLAADYERTLSSEQGSQRDTDSKDDDFASSITQQSGDDVENLIGFTTVQNFILGNKGVSQLDDELQQQITRGREYYQQIAGIKELDHLVRALDGGYIPVKNGGDPIRNPDSTPTGFNLYGFDPSRVPTEAAYEQGKELTTQLIADYYAKHGRYPDKLAFSLWSMETMRHYGVLEAQALYAMGVKPTWSPDGRVIGTEIISAGELKRPRVDVVLSATGLYRDAFPNVMQWLAKAIKEVAQLKEDNNSLWDNSQRVKAQLLESGIEAEEAEYLSTVRLFSNESGNYGSGLGNSTIASDSWEADDKLADLYLSRMGYYYGEDDSRWGQKPPSGVDLYAKQLSGTDMALFSRSSNVFGMLSSDDPFQYFGGLALAVRNIDGKSPEMYISNLRDADNPRAEDAATFLAKELRSRSFHTRWISEMMKEDYSGSVAMASTISNFFGWQVMDPNLVRDDQWQEFFEVYIEDKHELGLNEWFEQVNPKAQIAMLERMLEAARKDYWEASPETLQAMIERYQDLVNQYDLVVDNEKLREYAEDTYKQFGLELALPAPEVAAQIMPAAIQKASASQQVSGQKLEKVEAAETDFTLSPQLYLSLIACLIFILIGVLRQTGWRFLGARSAP